MRDYGRRRRTGLASWDFSAPPTWGPELLACRCVGAIRVDVEDTPGDAYAGAMVHELSDRRLSDAIKPRAAKRLRDFRREVEQRFPGRVKWVVLFGSRARGDAAAGSDYDVAVFIKDLAERRQIDHTLSDIAYPHILAGVHIRPVALPETFLTSPQRGTLATNIARDGVVVS